MVEKLNQSNLAGCIAVIVFFALWPFRYGMEAWGENSSEIVKLPGCRAEAGSQLTDCEKTVPGVERIDDSTLMGGNSNTDLEMPLYNSGFYEAVCERLVNSLVERGANVTELPLSSFLPSEPTDTTEWQTFERSDFGFGFRFPSNFLVFDPSYVGRGIDLVSFVGPNLGPADSSGGVARYSLTLNERRLVGDFVADFKNTKDIARLVGPLNPRICLVRTFVSGSKAVLVLNGSFAFEIWFSVFRDNRAAMTESITNEIVDTLYFWNEV